jgi:hypothetical protein
MPGRFISLCGVAGSCCGCIEPTESRPPKNALVIIDPQNAIVGMNTAPYPAAQIVQNSKEPAKAFGLSGASVVYVRVDLNDLLEFPIDEPHNLGDKQIPAVASKIAASAGFQPDDILIAKRHWDKRKPLLAHVRAARDYKEDVIVCRGDDC